MTLSAAVSVPRLDTAAEVGDAESRAWVAALRAEGPRRDRAVADLHELLVRAAAAGERFPTFVGAISTTWRCRARTTR
jgi:hypothetical protein